MIARVILSRDLKYGKIKPTCGPFKIFGAIYGSPASIVKIVEEMKKYV